jgi:hypothetical protein
MNQNNQNQDPYKHLYEEIPESSGYFRKYNCKICKQVIWTGGKAVRSIQEHIDNHIKHEQEIAKFNRERESLDTLYNVNHKNVQNIRNGTDFLSTNINNRTIL